MNKLRKDYTKIGCLARVGDILPPGDLPSPWPEPKPEPTAIETQLLRFLAIFCLDFIVNAFVLLIGYFILGRKELIKSWRFLKYVFFVTIGGALIDLIYTSGVYLSRFKGPFYPSMGLTTIVLLVSVFFTFLGLAFYNYWLSRRFFNLKRKEAIFIGVIVGILTNPALSFLYFLIPSFLHSVLGF